LFAAEPEMSDATKLNVDLQDVVTLAAAAAYTEPQDRDSLLSGLDQVLSGTPCDGVRQLATRLMPRVDSTDTVPDWVQDPAVRALLSARMHTLAESLQVRANASGGCTPLAVTPPRPIAWSTAIQYIHPNPMTRSTTIEYALRHAGPVTLAIFDLSGRRVSLLVDGDRTAGTHWASWNGRRDNGGAVPHGVYFARLTSGGATDRRSIVVVQ